VETSFAIANASVSCAFFGFILYFFFQQPPPVVQIALDVVVVVAIVDPCLVFEVGDCFFYFFLLGSFEFEFNKDVIVATMLVIAIIVVVSMMISILQEH
jgi:hypothetical protein